MDTQYIRPADKDNVDKVVGAIKAKNFAVELAGLATVTSQYDQIHLKVSAGTDLTTLLTTLLSEGAQFQEAHENKLHYLFTMNGTRLTIAYSLKPVRSVMPDCYF